MPRPGWESEQSANLGTVEGRTLNITCSPERSQVPSTLQQGEETEWFNGPASLTLNPITQGTGTTSTYVQGSRQAQIRFQSDGDVVVEVERPVTKKGKK